MTREEILQNFAVNKYGIITNPGKFEGELLYAPYFYDVILDGGSDLDFYDNSDEMLFNIFKITSEDCIYFPELTDTLFLVCFEDEQGFFYCKSRKFSEIDDFLDLFSEIREDILALL